MNPFDLTGPEFLGLYLFFFVLTLGLALYARRSLAQPVEEPADPFPQLDPYEVAYLAGKAPLAVNAAIANLLNRKVVTLDAKDRKLTATGELPSGAHPLEAALHLTTRGGSGETLKEIHARLGKVVEKVGHRLQDLKLVVDDGRALAARTVPLLLMLALAGFGAVKILVGLGRNKPVLFLAMFCAATVLVSLVVFARRPHRTRHGDRVLDRLKKQHSALQYAAREPGQLTWEELPLALGLFGLGVLAASGPLKELRTALHPPGSGWDAGTGCGSGCGGGGGGCGGGGCGGGGCGGCGG
jgi:uncharacterized protein (TIGR04222 family)